MDGAPMILINGGMTMSMCLKERKGRSFRSPSSNFFRMCDRRSLAPLASVLGKYLCYKKEDEEEVEDAS